MTEGFHRGYVPTDEGRVSYLHRAGTGPALLLIPGSFSDASQWDAVVARLPSSLNLVLVELRGHGGSWPPPRNGSIEQFAQDTLAIADAVGLRRFYVGGHSIGGMVSIEVGRAAPERVKGILSFEGWTNHHAAKDAFAGDMASALSAEQTAARQAERARVTAKWTEEEVRAFGRIWRQWDGSAFLQSTALPILEVYGDRGRPKPSPDALHIPDRPNITLRWVEGACHALPFERPDAVAEAVTTFIDRIESAAGPQHGDRVGLSDFP